jgi:dolichyl-phosphate-mannose-protein mannosyltransferase
MTARLRRLPVLPMALFAASAAFVFWRQTQVGVLVDISYILNTASRIAGGDVPYSEFRLAHPPLTFLTQAVLIRVFGPYYVFQMLYTSLASGVAAVMAYRVVRHLLRDTVSRPDVLAAVVCAPIVPLGIYAIFPHPHYDPDSALWVLVGLASIVAARERPTPRRWLLTGAVLVVPLFVKQNIGGAFLPSVLFTLVVDAIVDRGRVRQVLWCLGGVAAGLAIALAAIQLVAGLDNYVQWTIRYALSERGVRLDRFLDFRDFWLISAGLAIPVAAVVSSRFQPRVRTALPIAVGLLAVSAAAGTFLLVWVTVLVGALGSAALAAMRGRVSFETLLPLVTAGTLAGTLQGAGLERSSFGTFGLFVITLATIVVELGHLDDPRKRAPESFGVLAALIIIVFGAQYTLSNARLDFIDLAPNAPIAHSVEPNLWGLSARGRYLGEVDGTIDWIRRHVRPGEPMTFLPGEDPIYYAMSLEPGLPVIQFIDGSNPYTPDELARIADASGLRWVFVKELRQLRAPDDLPQGPIIVALLTRNADFVDIVGPYRVFRRR